MAHANAAHATPDFQPPHRLSVHYAGILEHLGLIRVGGPDAELFLQGQLSNDVFGLRPHAQERSTDAADHHTGVAQWTGYCTPKGRLICTGWLVRMDTPVPGVPANASSESAPYYLLLVDRGLLEVVLRRLRMFVLRAKVHLEDLSQTFQMMGSLRFLPPGKETASSDRQHTDLLSEAGSSGLKLEHRAVGPSIWVGLPPAVLPSGNRLERHLLIEAKEAMQLMNVQDTPEATAPLTALWHWTHHLAAEPWVGCSASERFVPQMVNFERIGGVNFRKGCYPGQEVVARSQYLGKLKRRMALFAWPDPYSAPPVAGNDLGEEAANPELTVVSSARRPTSHAARNPAHSRDEVSAEERPRGAPMDSQAGPPAGSQEEAANALDPFVSLWRLAYPDAGAPPAALILAEGRSDHVPGTLTQQLALPYRLSDS